MLREARRVRRVRTGEEAAAVLARLFPPARSFQGAPPPSTRPALLPPAPEAER